MADDLSYEASDGSSGRVACDACTVYDTAADIGSAFGTLRRMFGTASSNVVFTLTTPRYVLEGCKLSGPDPRITFQRKTRRHVGQA